MVCRDADCSAGGRRARPRRRTPEPGRPAQAAVARPAGSAGTCARCRVRSRRSQPNSRPTYSAPAPAAPATRCPPGSSARTAGRSSGPDVDAEVVLAVEDRRPSTALAPSARRPPARRGPPADARALGLGQGHPAADELLDPRPASPRKPDSSRARPSALRTWRDRTPAIGQPGMVGRGVARLPLAAAGADQRADVVGEAVFARAGPG